MTYFSCPCAVPELPMQEKQLSGSTGIGSASLTRKSPMPCCTGMPSTRVTPGADLGISWMSIGWVSSTSLRASVRIVERQPFMSVKWPDVESESDHLQGM